MPKLLRFISRAEKLKPPIRAAFVFEEWRLLLKFMPSDGLQFSISRYSSPGLFPSLHMLCLALAPLLSHVERLDFQGSPYTQYFGTPTEWLIVFIPFIAVQSLHVPEETWHQMEPALHALTEERATEVFPLLRTLFLEEPFEEAKKSLELLISARRLTVKPCTAPYLDTKY